MDKEVDGLTQSCLGKSKDGNAIHNNVTLPAAPTKWLKLTDVNGHEKRVKRAVACVVNSLFKGFYSLDNWEKKPIQRNGSLEDVERIKKTCANLGIDLKERDIVLNQARERILDTIKTVGASSNQNDECIEVFMLFVMSHGDKNGVIRTDVLKSGKKPKTCLMDGLDDFEEYKIDDIFKAINSNPNLTNSFIIVVIQACRGTLKETVFGHGCAGSTEPVQISNNSCRVPVFELPNNSIVVFATVEGNVSWRKVSTGTWLVQPLCDALNIEESNKEILELITHTQRSICENPAEMKKGIAGQTPEIFYNAHMQLRVLQNVVEGDAAVIDGFPILDKCNDEYYKWEQFSKGYSTIIKTCSLFDASKLKKTIEENLEIVTEVVEPKPCAKLVIEKAIEDVLSASNTAAYLLMIIVGKLISRGEENEVQEIYLDVKPVSIPLREIIRRLVLGSHNHEMIGKPKFFIFVHDETQEDEIMQLESDSIHVENEITTDVAPRSPLFTTNHADYLTYICVGKHDLDDLIKHLSEPKLRQGSSLQMELANCVRLSKQRVSLATGSPSRIQTLFTSTIRRLVNFPKDSDLYVRPLITDRTTSFCWNLELGWRQMLKEFLHPEQLAASPQVTPPYAAWLMVAPAGRGKTRFTRELADLITVREDELGCHVVRVKLRKHSAFFESCDTHSDKLRDYVQHFTKGRTLSQQKLVFIFDGYEQVCKLYSLVLDKLFKRISLDRHPMLITTRPTAESEITMTKTVNFKVVDLELLSVKSQSQIVAQQMTIPEEICDLLEKAKDQHFLDEEFTGNPQHLITMCNKELEDTNLQVFDLLHCIVRKLIKKALVKMDDIGENDDKLATHIRKRRELLVVANAKLQKLGFSDVTLSIEKQKLVNNIGILNYAEDIFYVSILFREFLVAIYLIHTFKVEGIQATNFDERLKELYPLRDFTIAHLLLKNYLNIIDYFPDDLLYSLDLKTIIY